MMVTRLIGAVLLAAPLAATPTDVAAQAVSGARSFQHAVHRDFYCGECHGTGAKHRSPRTWTVEGCASCHHARPSGFECRDCHAREAYAATRLTDATFAPSVWEHPRTRRLPFSHDTHDGLDCRSCHQGGILLEPNECATCHADHHRPEAECSQCHVTPEPEAHPLEAHVTCAGSGCHSAEAVSVRPMLSRSSCLICHADMRDHQPGRECAVCHINPDTSRVLFPHGGGRGGISKGRRDGR